ncbi:MAG: thiolase family protein [Melioribacteraceae bacterium]|nr:thiolase family protein [Melioribacteraceae bacterium]
MKKVVIAAACRTAIGSFQGELSGFKATELGTEVIKSVISRSGINVHDVDEVIMGNVLSAGTGQAPARQAALFAGMPDKTECLTVNKMCGSGMKAVMLADQAIKCGDADVIIAGGMESMTNAPYILQEARTGYRLGHGKVWDSMITDGLWDVYNNIHMGSCAESCAKEFKMSREEVDAFAVESYKRALKAQESGKFNEEITELIKQDKKNETVIKEDEEPKKVKFEKIPNLKPAFEQDGIITAANASKINDGAAALLVCSEDKAKQLELPILVEIISQSSSAKEPVNFTTAPADAIQKVLKKATMTINDINLFEINEAFAVVSIAVARLLNLDQSKVNVNGGAIALGHPIGASGARILVTLIHEMKRENYEFGLASLCIGGGEASAVIVKNY